MPYVGQKDFYPASLPADDVGNLAVVTLNGSTSYNRRLRATFESRRQTVMSPELQLANLFFVFGYQDAGNYWLAGVDHTRSVLPAGSAWANLGLAQVIDGVIHDDGLYTPIEAVWATDLIQPYELTVALSVVGSDLEIRGRLRSEIGGQMSEFMRSVPLIDAPNGKTGFATYRGTVAIRQLTSAPTLVDALYPSEFGSGVTAVFLKVADYAGHPCWYSADGLYLWSDNGADFYVSATQGINEGAVATRHSPVYDAPAGLYTPFGKLDIF